MNNVCDPPAAVNPRPERDKLMTALLEGVADLDGQQLAELVGHAETLLQADPAAGKPAEPLMTPEIVADIEAVATPLSLATSLSLLVDYGAETPREIAERVCCVLTDREGTPAERRVAWRVLELVESVMRSEADDAA